MKKIFIFGAISLMLFVIVLNGCTTGEASAGISQLRCDTYKARCEDTSRWNSQRNCNLWDKNCKPTCDDGIKNGNEQGIDCGGECAPCETDETLWIQDGNNVYYNGGKVGIGTMDPEYKLHVNGSIKAQGTICDDNGCIGGGSGSLFKIKIKTDLNGDQALVNLIDDATGTYICEDKQDNDVCQFGSIDIKLNVELDHADQNVILVTLRDDATGTVICEDKQDNYVCQYAPSDQEEGLTKQDVLDMLNSCVILYGGGGLTCNNLCNNDGKTCIFATEYNYFDNRTETTLVNCDRPSSEPTQRPYWDVHCACCSP